MILEELRPHQQAVAARLGEYWQHAASSRVEKERENTDAIRAYHYRHPAGKVIPRGHSKAMLPLLHVAARGLVADMVQGLMPFPRFFRVIMDTLEDDGAAAAIETELLHLIEQMELPRHLRTLMLQAALCSSSPYALDWHVKTRMVSKPVLQGGAGLREMLAAAAQGQLREAIAQARAQFSGHTVQREERPIYAGPRIQVLDWFDCMFDPCPPDGLDETEIWRQVQTRVTVAALRRMAAESEFGYTKYENVDQIDFQRPGEQPPGESDRLQRYQALGLDLSATTFDGGILLRHHYGPFDAKIGGETISLENVCATYTPDGKLLRFEYNTNPSGELPVQQITWAEPAIPGNPYAVSAAGPCLSISGYVNNLANDFRDTTSKIAKGQKTILNTSDLLDPTSEGVSIEMDGLIPVGRHDEIQPIDFDPKVFNLIEVMAHFELMLNKVSGAESKNSLENQARTATEMAQVGAALATEKAERVHHVQTQLQRLLTEVCQLRAAYGPEAAVQRRATDDEGATVWVTVTPEVFRAAFRVECIGAGVVSERAQQLAGLFQFLEVLPKLPPVQQLSVNYQLILKLIWSLAVGRNDDKIILPTAQLEAMIREIEQQRAGAALPGQGTGGTGQAGGVVPLRGQAGGPAA